MVLAINSPVYEHHNLYKAGMLLIWKGIFARIEEVVGKSLVVKITFFKALSERIWCVLKGVGLLVPPWNILFFYILTSSKAPPLPPKPAPKPATSYALPPPAPKPATAFCLQMPNGKSIEPTNFVLQRELKRVTDSVRIRTKLVKEMRRANEAMRRESETSGLKDLFTYAIRGNLKVSSEEWGFESGMQVAAASAKGDRPSMEDAHIAEVTKLTKHNDVPLHVLGVFDGHGGSAASKWVAQYITRIIKTMLEDSPDLSGCSIWNALKMAFVATHFHMQSYVGTAGTTATVACILNGKLWVANAGDSWCVAQLRSGRTLALTDDAKASDRFVKSVEKRGGKVNANGRVNGDINVLRALGDFHSNLLSPERHHVVSPRPKITCVSLKYVSHILMGCDGLTDVAKRQKMMEGVMNDTGSSLKNRCINLVNACFHSKDNLTALLAKI